MLNRHAIVLFLGVAGIVLLSSSAMTPAAVRPASALGLAFILLIVGLFLDEGTHSLRSLGSRLLQASAAACLLVAAAGHLQGQATVPLGLAELGILLTSVGVLLELMLSLRWLKMAVAVHALGDLVFVVAAVLAATARNAVPSKIGWVFIALVGSLSLYAAASNLILQLARLRRVSAGWRFSVTKFEPSLQLRTPRGLIELPRTLIESVSPLDARQLLIVLGSSLPGDLTRSGLPVEELVSKPGDGEGRKDSKRLGIVFHEQELGFPVAIARRKIQRHGDSPVC